jgi:hypothetical protein
MEPLILMEPLVLRRSLAPCRVPVLRGHHIPTAKDSGSNGNRSEAEKFQLSALQSMN